MKVNTAVGKTSMILLDDSSKSAGPGSRSGHKLVWHRLICLMNLPILIHDEKGVT
jgi:hypothetical protein